MNAKELKEENIQLKKELDFYKSDNYLTRHYIAYLKKLDEMSDMFNSHQISDIELDDKDDKQFDRQMKLMERSNLIVNTIEALEKRINPLIVKAAQDSFGSEYEEALNMARNYG